MNNLLIKSTKILIIVCVFYYLIKNDHLNLNFFLDLSSNILITSFLAFFIFITYIIGAYRWSLILKSTNIKNSFYENLKIYYMCTFFNNFLFGNLGGDFIKVYYISTLTTSNRIKNSFSIVIDRLFGFFGLTLVSVITFLLILYEKNQIENILKILLISVIFFITIFFGLKISKKINFFNKLFDYFQLNISLLIKCTLLSVLIFLIVQIVIFLISNEILMFNINLKYIFFSNSISQLISAIPISPGGIGLGEISFVLINKNLFNIYLNNLANIIIYFRFLVLITSLPGVILFFNYKNKNKINF